MSILSAIGNTPIVELNALNKNKTKVRILGKLEGANPGGSIKDRPAYWMIKKAEESIVPKIYDQNMLDEKITIEDGEAFETTRLLAAREGIFVGMSSGAAVAGALHVAENMACCTIIAIPPDRGDRYLSTMLFRSICAKCPP